MPTVRIDEDVYDWLKSQAIPFEDTPNSVLRRLAGFNKLNDTAPNGKGHQIQALSTKPNDERITGKVLKALWGVTVKHALYSHDGNWYENLRHFPGALFDFNGYLVFNTVEEYERCPYLNIGKTLNVHEGISSIPGYKRMR